MITVTPYINTLGNEKYKNFLSVPFTVDMLSPVNEKPSDTLFDGWRGKSMGSWYKFSNDDKITLEFFVEYYSIGKEANTFKASQRVSHKMPFPRNINDFINDMDRFGIKLYWTLWIDQNFEPKEYLESDEIKEYFIDLLGKLEKSNELNL
jgi:hypothetical protein